MKCGNFGKKKYAVWNKRSYEKRDEENMQEQMNYGNGENYCLQKIHQGLTKNFLSY